MSSQYGALSGLAILLIVINHSIEYAINATPSALASWQVYLLTTLQALGVFAVPMFLFISGSFVAYAAQGDPPRLSRKFLFSSLRHVILPYLIWSIVFYLFVLVLKGERYSPAGYVKNLLVGYPFHFVPLLVFYYIISPLLVRIGRFEAGILLLILIGLYQLVLINLLNPGYLGFELPEMARFLAVPVLRTTLADWAIYFPLGLVLGMRARQWIPRSQRLMWMFAGLTLLLFVLGLLNAFAIFSFPLARFLCPLPLVLLLPGIKRDSIPLVRPLERVGRRSYGIYLTHLIILNLVLFALNPLIPGIFTLPILVSLLFFLIGVGVPLLIMESVAKGPAKQFYRSIFG
jgi:peptidoglycan/LPS O-acetylase OafA/YrhL